MPAEFQILPTLRLKHARIWGRTNFAEIESCFTRTLTDPAFRFDLRILADLRGLTDPVGGLWEFWKLKQMYKTVYGAVHQFGAEIRANNPSGLLVFRTARGRVFGVARHVTIPARPYLGLSAADRTAMGRVVTSFYRRAIGMDA